MVRQPVSVAFAPIQSLQSNLILGSLVAGILLAGVGWLITRWLISPILGIASAADQICQGNTNIKLPTFQGKDEIARLSQTLKQLICTIKQREQPYRTLVENFPNGAVLLFDHDLSYTLVDGKELAEIGPSKEVMEGKTIWECLPPETAQMLEPIYREALAGCASTFEISYADRIYIVDTLPIKNEQGEISGGMVMSQNIAERKRAEIVLLKLTDDLEIKVQERTADLSDANQQLQQEIIVRRFVEQQLHESQICLKLINSISTETTFGTSPFAAIKRTLKKLSKHFKHLRVAYSTINRRGILTVIRAIEPTGMPSLKGLIIDLTTAHKYLAILHQQ